MAAKPKTMKGELINPGSGPHQCETCRKLLQASDHITYTLDMRRMWHTKCFEKTLVPLKELQKRMDTLTPCAICGKPIAGGTVTFTHDDRLAHASCPKAKR